MPSLEKTGIILAIAAEDARGEDRALFKLGDKPLLNRVINEIKGVVDEVIIVVSSDDQLDSYRRIVPSFARFVEVADSSSHTLCAAMRGFEIAQGSYSLILPSDSPFVYHEVVSLLFELCSGKSAVVPRWPSNECEPLHAVYNTANALQASRQALAAGEVDLTGMLSYLRGVRYLSTLVIEQLDPDFRSFFRVKTQLDLKKAVVMNKPRKHS